MSENKNEQGIEDNGKSGVGAIGFVLAWGWSDWNPGGH